jgi:hypothetical protein
VPTIYPHTSLVSVISPTLVLSETARRITVSVTEAL